MLSPPQVLLHHEPLKLVTDVFLLWCMLELLYLQNVCWWFGNTLPLHAEYQCQVKEAIIFFVFTIEERRFGPDFQSLYILLIPFWMLLNLGHWQYAFVVHSGLRKGISLLAVTRLQRWSITMMWNSSWSRKNGERNQSMRSPIDGTPPQSKDQWRSSNQR